MTGLVSDDAKETVKAVVETADTSVTAVVELSETMTVGVVVYGEAKVSVQAVMPPEPALMVPVTSLAFAASVGETPQLESVGVARVDEANRCPY